MDNFNCGYLSDAAKIYAAIRRRDAVVQACVQKRKRATSRLTWTIVEMGNDEAASKEHSAFLEDFYNNIRVTSAEDANKRGSMSMLVENILSALETSTLSPKSSGTRRERRRFPRKCGTFRFGFSRTLKDTCALKSRATTPKA